MRRTSFASRQSSAWPAKNKGSVLEEGEKDVQVETPKSYHHTKDNVANPHQGGGQGEFTDDKAAFQDSRPLHTDNQFINIYLYFNL